MDNDSNSLVCFSSINLSDVIIKNNTANAIVKLESTNGSKNEFLLRAKYDKEINREILPILRLAFCMPLLNYGLFSQKFELGFPLDKHDLTLLKILNEIFSRDVYVNKILRRRADYIIPKYLPDVDNINPNEANPKAEIFSSNLTINNVMSNKMDKQSCGILSSGGKESLLTYGLLKEIGANVYPLYVNESGGHWRTAISAYSYHKKSEKNTNKVWTNVDRFYVFMLDHLDFIRKDHRKIHADTYPIRLCIFPYYVFLLLPIFIQNNIGNLLIGSEFDDLRSFPNYHGIPHYYGIYDQHQDFDIIMNNWYSNRIPGLKQWSAVRPISGLIVERILVNRYHELAKNQRSCHSCHLKNNEIIPCGKCSKCLGVLLFLFANKADPKLMNFKQEHIDNFPNKIKSSNLRLDQDEKDQSFYLLKNNGIFSHVKPVEHVECIHIHDEIGDQKLVPEQFRNKILKIFEEYTNGYCILENDSWKKIDKKILSIM